MFTTKKTILQASFPADPARPAECVPQTFSVYISHREWPCLQGSKWVNGLCEADSNKSQCLQKKKAAKGDGNASKKKTACW